MLSKAYLHYCNVPERVSFRNNPTLRVWLWRLWTGLCNALPQSLHVNAVILKAVSGLQRFDLRRQYNNTNGSIYDTKTCICDPPDITDCGCCESSRPGYTYRFCLVTL
jgi:hypothetical protein